MMYLPHHDVIDPLLHSPHKLVWNHFTQAHVSVSHERLPLKTCDATSALKRRLDVHWTSGFKSIEVGVDG